MKIEQFDLERGQSLYEHHVEINLSESGVHPVTLRELAGMGLDLEDLLDAPLAYIQTNGSPELRGCLSKLYPGTTPDHFLVTNGTAEANFLLTQVLVEPGDEILMQVPNYLQVAGLARSLGAEVETFTLRQGADGWALDWDEVERALSPRTRLIYVSHPNNPTGHVLAEADIDRLVELADRHEAWLIADQIYRGTEHDGVLAPSFWGRSERVVVTAGLSKAYGIPGARIGWIAGPPELAARCWHHRDYTTIAPGALSDKIAQFAVAPKNADKLYRRARGFMTVNRRSFERWVEGQSDWIHYTRPMAGAYAFVRYDSETASGELGERLRLEESVLVVPGIWAGLEHHLRISLGVEAEVFERGLERLARVLATLPRAATTAEIV